MAGEGITFKTFGSDGQAQTAGGDQGPQPLSGSFEERAAAIKGRMAGQVEGSGAPTTPVGAPTSSAVTNPETLKNLSEGRVRPSEIPASEYAKMSWGDYIPKVASNVLPSTYEAVKGIGNAIIHPIDTATAIGQVGAGLGSKALDTAGEAIGYGPVLDPSRKAEREAVVNALGQSYAGRYGMGEEGEVWKHLAEDPASYLSDIASVASGGAGAAGKLGIINKAGNIAKAAEMVSKVDPIQLALKTTGKAVSTAGKAIPYSLMSAQSLASGLPMKMLKTAREAGLSGDPEKINDFLSSMKGDPKFSGEAVDAIESAIDDMSDKASQEYMSNQATAFGRTQPVDLSAPTAARDVVEGMVNPGGVLRSPVTYTPSDLMEAKAAIDQIDNAITHPSAGATTIQELDVVKKNIDRIAKRIDDPALKSRVQAMAGELVTAMSNTDPAYGEMMKGWQEFKRQLNNVKKDFGTKAMSDTSRSRRLAKAFKSDSPIFDLLEGTPSGKNLRYSIAGDAMKNWVGDRAHSTLAGIGGPLAAIMAMGYHPGVIAAAIPGLGLASPKIGGLSQMYLGKAENLVNKNAGRALDALSYSPALTNVASQYGAARQERKAGGRVSSHEAAADQLVRAADHAKKGQSAQTEALLNQSDNSVAHALEIANRSI